MRRDVRWVMLEAGLSLAGGCGGSTDEDGSGGSGGSGGAGATGGSGGSGGAGGSSASGGVSGSAGSGQTCGGLLGEVCPSGEWCNFTPDSCGNGDQTGQCEATPAGCEFLYAPVCGCDGQLYENDCVAYTAGVDVNGDGGCTAPSGMFPCGGAFCESSAEYCERITDDTGLPPIHTCKPLPAQCVGETDCACFPSTTPCVEICDVTVGNGNGFVLICPGG